MSLAAKKCVPCERGVPPMTAGEIRNHLDEVPGWEVRENRKIVKNFPCKNFKAAVAFVNTVADLAEAEGHHPDILIHGWNNVRLELSTHAIGGLSENDFIVAAKIDQL